jgi:hypothetical protein
VEEDEDSTAAVAAEDSAAAVVGGGEWEDKAKAAYLYPTHNSANLIFF